MAQRGPSPTRLGETLFDKPGESEVAAKEEPASRC